MAKPAFGFPLAKVLEDGTGALAMLVTAVKTIDIGRELSEAEKDLLSCSRCLLVQWRKRIHERCAAKKIDRLQVVHQLDRIEQALCWVLVKRRGMEWNESDDDEDDRKKTSNAAAKNPVTTVSELGKKGGSTPTADPAEPVKSSEILCHLCSGSHILIHCDKFRNMLSSARLQFVKKKLLCANCYGVNHTSEKCPSEGRCLRCDGKHHTKLHAGMQQKQ